MGCYLLVGENILGQNLDVPQVSEELLVGQVHFGRVQLKRDPFSD